MRKDIAKPGGIVGVIGIVLLVIGAILVGITAEYCESVWFVEVCTTYNPYAGVGLALMGLGFLMAIIGGIIALIGAVMKEQHPYPSVQTQKFCTGCGHAVNSQFCINCGRRQEGV